jgi:hypothetical protein
MKCSKAAIKLQMCKLSYKQGSEYPWHGEWHLRTSDFKLTGPLAMYYGKGKPWEKDPFWLEIASGGPAPVKRYRHASAMFHNQLVVFGGFGPLGFMGDLSLFDCTAKTWKAVGHWTKAKKWVGGTFANEGVVRAPGGASLVYVYDPSKIEGSAPHPRAGSSLAAFNDRLVLYAGYSGSAGLHSDVYIIRTGCVAHPMGTQKWGQFDCSSDSRWRWEKPVIIGRTPTAR